MYQLVWRKNKREEAKGNERVPHELNETCTRRLKITTSLFQTNGLECNNFETISQRTNYLENKENVIAEFEAVCNTSQKLF